MPFSAASFRTAGVALTSERSGRSAVAVDAGAADEDEDAIEGAGDDARCGCEGAEGVGSDGGRCDGDGADAGDADEGG